MVNFALNALDQSAVHSDNTPQAAVLETVSLACYLETLGYKRFWLAEHHNTAAFADAAPEILIAHIAAQTTRLRVGSGGIMLPHYSALKVAEQFRMLAALAPNRIDLGLGRAPGGDPKTAAALQAGPQSWGVDVFPQQVELLQQFLANDFPAEHPYFGIHAQPLASAGEESETPVPLYMLGSGGDGAIHAAQFGLPYVYAHFINPDGMDNAIALYREHFRPSRQCPAPLVMVGVSVLAGESAEAAAIAARPRDIWAAKLRLGRAGVFPSMGEAAAYTPDAAEQGVLDMLQGRGLTGTAAKVMAGLNDMATRGGIDEFFLLTLCPDAQARRTSYRLLAEAALDPSHTLGQNKKH